MALPQATTLHQSTLIAANASLTHESVCSSTLAHHTENSTEILSGLEMRLCDLSSPQINKGKLLNNGRCIRYRGSG